MNIKILLALCLITFLLLPDAESWGGRRRRRRFRVRIRVRRIIKPICKVACYVKGCSYVMVSGVAQYVCRRTCNKICKKLGDEPMNMEQDESVFQDPKSVNFVLPQPWKMSVYDKNKDGRISRAEFTAAMPKSLDQKGLDRVFNAADKNGDGYLSCGEFRTAKLDFYSKPEC